MRHASRWLTATVLLSCLLSACGGDSVAPVPPPAPPPGPPPPPPPPPPPAAIGDTLLMGSSTAVAISAIVSKSPTPAPSQEIAGFLVRTRLTAMVNPSATVGAVNEALLAHGARVDASLPGTPFLVLRIPPVADVAGARAFAATLVGTGAFLLAKPEFVAATKWTPLLPPSGDTGISHLIPSRLPAAWNAKSRATARMRVVLADYFHQLVPLAAVSPLRFLGSAPTAASPGENHGFLVAGILAANHDDTPFTGAFPRTELIDIDGVSMEGLGWGQTTVAIRQNFPATGSFLINTSLGYPTGPQTADTALYAAIDALHWRIAVASEVGRFLHLTAASNEGDLPGLPGQAFSSSPYNLARFQGDLNGYVQGLAVSAIEKAAFAATWNWAATNVPGALLASDNLLSVGSSSRAGVEWVFSSRGSDVRAVGEIVFAPCVVQDTNYPGNPTRCNGTSARYSGTSMATPLVAGIAAYLWSINPTLTPVQLRARLQEAYNQSPVQGVLDAYWAVLRLDAGLGNAPVRRELLDVASGPGTPGRDGRFDEHDIGLFTQAFLAYHGQRLAAGTPNATDHSRFDLNGDGITGDTTRREAFDLNADGTFSTLELTMEGASRQFNELFLSDFRILCYYAYSPLYQGSPDARRDALPGCVPPEEPPPELPEPGIFRVRDMGYWMHMRTQGNVVIPGTGDCLLDNHSFDAPLPVVWSRNASCSFPQGNATASMDLKDDGRGKASVSVSGNGQYQSTSGLFAGQTSGARVTVNQGFVIVRPGAVPGGDGTATIRIKVKLVASNSTCTGQAKAHLRLDSPWGIREWDARFLPCVLVPGGRSMTIEEVVTVPFNFTYGVPSTRISALMDASYGTHVSTVDYTVREARASVEYELTFLNLPGGAVVLGSDGNPWGAPAGSPPQGTGSAPSAMKR